jgi:hypothetical protein
MEKKDIILIAIAVGLLVIALAIVVSNYFGQNKGLLYNPEPIIPQGDEEPFVEKEPLVMGAGWSSSPKEETAVKESVEMMLEQMGEKSPSFVIVYSETSYDNVKISQELNNLLGQGVKIYGWTSFQHTTTNGGMQNFSILGFSERMRVGVGGCDLKEVNYPGENGSKEEIFSSTREAARLATQRAVEDAGKNVNEKPNLVLISGATYFMPGTIKNPVEERYIEGIESIVGKETPIIGGLAADTTASGNEKVFVNDQVFGFGSVSVAVLYTDVKIGFDALSPKIGYGFLGGFTPTNKSAVVTKAEGHLLYELDGRPCADVYNEWTNGALSDRISTTEWVIDYTALNPLAEKISLSDEVPGYYNKLIHYFNNPEPGVCKLACEVENGSTLHLLQGTPQMFVERGALAAQFARSHGKITADEIAGGYMVFCAGSFLTIPQKDYPAIGQMIDQAMAGAPFIGGYEFGGFGSFVGARENVFTTQMVSFLIFGKN